MGNADVSTLSFGGVRFKLSTGLILALILQFISTAATAGAVWTKLDNRISRLEEAMTDARTSRDRDRVASDKLIERMNALSEQLARLEERLAARRNRE